MNIRRGPFGEVTPGIFGMTAQGILQDSDRPEVIHRGVHVLRAAPEHGMFGPTVDKYPDATGWSVSEDGRLDVECVDARHVDVGSYPSGCWSRVWFPGAEHHVTSMKLPADEDENGEREDVEPHEG